MEDILDKQAQDIERQVESDMESILSESPDYVALLEQEDQVPVDPETLALARLTAQMLVDLMEALKRPGALSDLTLLTQVEDASNMAADMLVLSVASTSAPSSATSARIASGESFTARTARVPGCRF